MPEPSNRGIHFPEQQHQQKSDTGGSLGTVKDKAQEVASTVAKSAEQAWDTTRHQAEQAWDTTRQQAQQYASQVGDYAQETFQDVAGFIRRYPVASVLGGVAVGMMIAGAFGGLSMLRDNGSRYR